MSADGHETTKTPRHQEEGASLPDGWRWARLGDVCELNPRRPSIDRDDSHPTSFIPMEAVDAMSGAVADMRTRRYEDIKRGYTYFANGDVLFAKITPCMQNGKHAIAKGLIDGIGFGTTEFHVLRPNAGITSEWIWSFVRRPSILDEASEHFTGAVGQQRLPQDYLANLEIPLPPLAEQQRIAGVLREQMAAVDKARAAAQARLEAAKALPAAYLRQVFPQAGHALPEGWRVLPLGDAGEVVSGVTIGRVIQGNGIRDVPYLRVANVKDGYLDLLYLISTPATEAEVEALRLRKGDLLLTEGGDPDKLGRGTLWDEQIPECIHQNHIFRVRLHREWVEPTYSAALIGSWYGKAYFLRHAKQTTGIATINQRVLKAFPMLLPPLAEQRRIAALLKGQMAAVEKARTAVEAEMNAINALPAALLRRAFAGEV